MYILYDTILIQKIVLVKGILKMTWIRFCLDDEMLNQYTKSVGLDSIDVFGLLKPLDLFRAKFARKGLTYYLIAQNGNKNYNIGLDSIESNKNLCEVLLNTSH